MKRFIAGFLWLILITTNSTCANPQSIASTPKTTQIQKTSSNLHHPQYGTDQIPFVVKIQPPTLSKEETDKKASEWRKSISDGLIAFAAIVSAIFTGMLWDSTRKLWKASEKQLQLTKDVLSADKRAFISAASLGQYWEKDLGTQLYNWRFRPQWKNSGETHTKNMTMHADCLIRDTQLPNGFNFDYPTTKIGSGLISPKDDVFGGIAPQPPANAVTPQDILACQAGTKFIYVLGWIKYFDVFPNSKRHITRFCWQIIPAGDPLTFVPNSPGTPPAPGTLSFGFVHYAEGNSAYDEDV